jgi:peptidoglycan/LPS O-acetylase OafA/YrhL
MNEIIKYRADIDGLRAISVIAVLVFHLNAEFLPGGFLGVDYFFVISGYLITRIIVKEIENNSFSFARFFARRLKRIFPALFTVLLASSIFAIISLPSDFFENFVKSLRYASAQLSNFLFVRKTDYFDDTSELRPLLHTWSLAVEEQFYLVWPILIFAICKLKGSIRKKLLAFFVFSFIISFSSYSYWLNINPNQSFYMFYNRAWEFCLGAIIALDLMPAIRGKLWSNFLGLLSLIIALACLYFVSSGNNQINYLMLLSVLSVTMLIESGKYQRNLASILISNRLFVFIGLISYSLYLWHWPIISFYKHIFIGSLDIVGYIIISLLSFILATLSYYFIEQKTRYIKNIRDKKVIIIGLFMIGLFIGYAKFLENIKESDWRIKKLDYANGKSEKELFSKNDLKEFFANPYAKENSADETKAEIVIIGDSHAERYFPIINRISNDLDLKAKYVTRPACASLIGDFMQVNLRADKISKNIEQHCLELQERIKQTIDDSRVKHIFIAMRQAFYTETTLQKGHERNRTFLISQDDEALSKEVSREIFRKNLEYTIKYSLDKGKEVHILGQVPVLFVNPNRCSEVTILEGIIYGDGISEYKYNKCYKIDFDYLNERLSYSSKLYRELSEKYDLFYLDPTEYFF